MELITFEEEKVQRSDTSQVMSIHGTGRLTFEVAYEITKEAIDKGLEDELRKTGRQHCKEHMLKMLHDAIEKLEGGESL